MAKQENAVMYAVEQVCGLYRVDVFRMQSRVMTVKGAAGRERPMFFGRWKDARGIEHYGGMADFLARPRVPLYYYSSSTTTTATLVTVPLWIETKAAEGKLSYDQLAFRQHVLENGEHYVTVKESLDPLMEFFREHGIREGGR